VPSFKLTSTEALLLLVSVQVAGLVVANAIAGKLVVLGGAVFTAGALAYPVTYVLQDVISERWGHRTSSVVVVGGFLGAVVLALYSHVGLLLPAIDAEHAAAYNAMFAATPRVVVASLTAYLIGGLLDVRVFFAVRALTGQPHLWLRKCVSTAVSQLIDSLLFVCIAFWSDLPLSALLSMGLAQYAFKMVCAVGGLPISYTILARLRVSV